MAYIVYGNYLLLAQSKIFKFLKYQELLRTHDDISSMSKLPPCSGCFNVLSAAGDVMANGSLCTYSNSFLVN